MLVSFVVFISRWKNDFGYKELTLQWTIGNSKYFNININVIKCNLRHDTHSIAHCMYNKKKRVKLRKQKRCVKIRANRKAQGWQLNKIVQNFVCMKVVAHDYITLFVWNSEIYSHEYARLSGKESFFIYYALWIVCWKEIAMVVSTSAESTIVIL